MAARPNAGWVIALSGDLGAGKTQFVRGLARGLGIAGARAFADVHAGERIRRRPAETCFIWIYTGWKRAEQILSAGIEEFLSPDGVAVIEWAERLKAESGERKAENRRVGVNIEIVSETERKIIYDDFGA